MHRLEWWDRGATVTLFAAAFLAVLVAPIADLSLAPILAPVLPKMETVHTVIVVGDGDASALDVPGKRLLRYDDLLAAESDEFDWPVLDENSAAAMCYTSGTTGHPKGVVYSHRSSYLHSMAVCSGNGMGLGFADRALPIVPMFHANAWGLPYAALMAGADLVLPDRFMDAASMVNLIETQRPTVAGAVPTIWNDVMNYLESNGGHDISSLRLVACGGSAVPVSLMQTFEDRHGVQIRQLWGMTETSPMATLAWPPPGTPEDRYWTLRASQGRPMCGVEARIVDDEGAALPNDGESVGELEVRGPWVASSYFSGEGADRFSEDGWFKTGDVVTIDAEGYLRITDRSKDVIKSGGEWISSVALENALMSHPAVLEAAVFAARHPKWSERPLAAIVVKEGKTVSKDELNAHLASKFAKFWLPDDYIFMSQIPRTSTGKFLKTKLRELHGDHLEKVETQA